MGKPRRTKRITHNEIKQIISAKKVGRYPCKDNLYLNITDSGTVNWCIIYDLNGKRKMKGMGAFDSAKNNLAIARAKCDDCLVMIRKGIDPKVEEKLGLLAHKSKEKELGKAKKLEDATFERLAMETIESKQHRWTNEKTGKQWESSLRQYAFPIIGHLPVSEIDTDHIYEILKPIWYTKTETADRVRRRIEAVLSRAKTLKLRTGENPALWRDHISNLFDPPKAAKDAREPEENRHHPSLPYKQLPEFMVELQKRIGAGARALEMCIMYSNRTNEVLKAKWDEIDLDAQIWTIPAVRMKKKKAHAVPLTNQAIELLTRMNDQRISEYVFPHTWSQAHNGNHLSQAGMSSVLKRMQAQRPWRDDLNRNITTHGFRTTFRTYIANETDYNGEIAEFALAHKLKDKAQAPYQQGDFLEKRIGMMQDYANYAYSNPDKPRDNVSQIRA
mgnify:CR=1 FL=1|tara:strand:+ start:307 stop:1641 length:1335 start_codon:yes stop_codon:yes gene_type:complete